MKRVRLGIAVTTTLGVALLLCGCAEPPSITFVGTTAPSVKPTHHKYVEPTQTAAAPRSAADESVLFLGAVLDEKYDVTVADAEWLDIAQKDCAEYASPTFYWYWPAEFDAGTDAIAKDRIGAEVMAFMLEGTNHCGNGGAVPSGRFTDEFYTDAAALTDARAKLGMASFEEGRGNTSAVRQFLDAYTDSRELFATLSGQGSGGGGSTLCNDGWLSPSTGSGTCSHHGGEPG